MNETNYNNHKILFDTNQIEERVNELAERINTDFYGRTLDIVCLVNSAFFFCADLIRRLKIPTRLHFMSFVSYPEGNISGEVRILLDIDENINDRDVLVIEGIIVSGRTPKYLLDILSNRKPASISLCALGFKPKFLKVDLPLKYVAFELGEEIAIGYGVGTGIIKASSQIVSLNQSI